MIEKAMFYSEYATLNSDGVSNDGFIEVIFLKLTAHFELNIAGFCPISYKMTDQFGRMVLCTVHNIRNTSTDQSFYITLSFLSSHFYLCSGC